MVQTVSLDEKEHAIAMLRKLKQMRHDKALCDFTIKVGKDEYHAHKYILSAGSEYFEAMMKHEMVEARDGAVEMKGVDFGCVKSCIDFMYTGRFDIPDGKMGDLLHVAIMMELNKVTNAISGIMENSLKPENFYQTRELSITYYLETVSAKCKVFYEENFKAISVQPGFKFEKANRLMNIFRSANCRLSEQEKLTASLRWVEDSPDVKKEELLELLGTIRLYEIPSEHLKDLIANHPIISNDFRMYKVVNAALLENKARSGEKKEFSILFNLKLDCLESYDPVTNGVTKFHDEKFKQLRSFSAVAMESHIYVLCEDMAVYRLNHREKTSKWEMMQNMIAEHGPWPPVAVLSRALFVIGIRGGLSKVNDVEKFDPDANQWLKLRDKPTPVRDAAIVSLGDSIYCIGGWDGKRCDKTFCRFTPSSSVWVDLEPMRKGRSHCSCVTEEHKIFVIGGTTGYKGSSEMECYLVKSAQWTSLAPMRQCDGMVKCIVSSEYLYVFKGGIAEKYDIASDKWKDVQIGRAVDVYDALTVNVPKW